MNADESLVEADEVRAWWPLKRMPWLYDRHMGGHGLAYHLYVPHAQAPLRPLPLVLWLHGGVWTSFSQLSARELSLRFSPLVASRPPAPAPAEGTNISKRQVGFSSAWRPSRAGCRRAMVRVRTDLRTFDTPSMCAGGTTRGPVRCTTSGSLSGRSTDS